MIRKIESNQASGHASRLSDLKPKQIRVATNVDISVEYLKELFEGSEEPAVVMQLCDHCNQGQCIECLRGIVTFGTRANNSIEFDKSAYKIIKETDLPIRITYETVYEELSAERAGETTPVERQVFIEMDSRLKPFIKNTLEERSQLGGGAAIFKIQS